MITLLHGDDTVKSRNELMKLKQLALAKEVREIDGKKVADSDLIQALSSSSLFGKDTLVVIENLFSGLGKKIKRIEQLGAIIASEAREIDVILWEDKEVGKTAQSVLGKSATTRVFKIPVVLFEFLDTLGTSQKKRLLELYSTVCAKEPIELTFAMLVKRVRQLIMISGSNASVQLSPWQKTRLTNQARTFTLNRLSRLYQSLKTIEYERNMGLSVLKFEEEIAGILLKF